MPPIFNIVRAVAYCLVLLFSSICLAMSAQFQRLLASSDLTRFVPFAIFVCTISMVIFVVILLSGLLLRERSPISSRIELACLGLLGILWLALGGFLASSEAQSADVECYASESSQEPLDDSLASFHTDQFQAMYRVLIAFSLLNAIIVLACFFILLFLVWRRHQRGDRHMWYVPVTAGAWLHSYAGKPQTRHRSTRRHDESVLPTTDKEPRAQVYLTEKPVRVARGHGRQNSRRLATEAIVDGGMRNPTTRR